MMLTIPPNYLPACVALAVLFVLVFAWRLDRLEKRREARLHGFAEAGLLARLIDGYRPALRRPLNAMVLLGVFGLLVALAGPRWGSKRVADGRSGREILVLLDTSESMNAVNPPPDRLTRAREKVSALLEAFPADRFGLIAFSGAAALECPLTRDHGYFKTVLQSVTTDTLTAEGTDIEAAFQEVENLFSEERGAGRSVWAESRIILLISDGEVVSGDAVKAAERLSDIGRVVVMGIGDPEGAEVTLPQWMSRSKYAPKNSAPHWSVLDEAQLAAIAMAGGGVYVRSTLGDDDLAVIKRELSYLQGHSRESDPVLRSINRYRWPLFFGLLFLAGEGAWLVLMPRIARHWPASHPDEEVAHGLD